MGWGIKLQGRDIKMQNKPMEDADSIYCLAKNRQGKPCKRVKAKGKKRCYMHGGAAGSGAPKGNKNAFKHGRYSAENLARRAMATKLFRQFKDLQDEYDI